MEKKGDAVIQNGRADVFRPDKNEVTEIVEVPLRTQPVIQVGGEIVSVTKRKQYGANDGGTKIDIPLEKEPPTRWGLPEDPPGRARLLG